MEKKREGNNSITRKYMNRTRQSENLFEKAKKLLPAGIGGSAPPFDPYPFYVEEAQGSKIWDVDGNEYLDFNLCWGVMLIGHRHPTLAEGLVDKIGKGTMYGFPHPEIYDVAKALTNRFPIDKLRFVNSGSEATLYAVRLARRFTGKKKIVKTEGAYHGVFDPLHISKKPHINKAGPPQRPTSVPHGEGILDSTCKHTIVAPYNDIQTMEKLLKDHLGEVAAVIVEPVMMNSAVIPPRKGYLKALRELTKEYNIPLIFDEVKTGIKIAPGGAADYYGIEPDLVTLAKAIGGGLPMGAVGGKREIMKEVGNEGLFGTFSANPLAIRAAKITLTEILTEEAYGKLENLGAKLLAGYRDIVEDHKLKAVVQGINAVGGIIFTENRVQNFRDWVHVDKEKTHHYWLSMVNKGVIPMAYGADEEWLVSTQHTKTDIQKHLEAFKEVASIL